MSNNQMPVEAPKRVARVWERASDAHYQEVAWVFFTPLHFFCNSGRFFLLKRSEDEFVQPEERNMGDGSNCRHSPNQTQMKGSIR
jgi:hypothetical protein